jgi:hypothetical protein
MKILNLLIFSFFSLNALAQSYECKSHPEWQEDKHFQAKINIDEANDSLSGEIISISLSDPWPLSESCDRPKPGIQLVGSRDGNEIKLGIEDENECGFVFYIVVLGSAPTMLSPRKTYKVYGHKPYLAICNAI